MIPKFQVVIPLILSKRSEDEVWETRFYCTYRRLIKFLSRVMTNEILQQDETNYQNQFNRETDWSDSIVIVRDDIGYFS